MTFNRLTLPATFLAISGPAMANQVNEAKGASPEEIRTWASKIQQAYPAEALRKAEEGAVSMRLEIAENGRIGKCDVTTSSGSVALDEAACEGMIEHARYKPAIDADGHPTADIQSMTISYTLPEESKMAFAPPFMRDEDEWQPLVLGEGLADRLQATKSKRAIFGITIDEAGDPSGCGVMYPSGDAAVDRALCERLLAYAKFYPTELTDGSTLPGSITLDLPSFNSVTLIEPAW